MGVKCVHGTHLALAQQQSLSVLVRTGQFCSRQLLISSPSYQFHVWYPVMLIQRWNTSPWYKQNWAIRDTFYWRNNHSSDCLVEATCIDRDVSWLINIRLDKCVDFRSHSAFNYTVSMVLHTTRYWRSLYYWHVLYRVTTIVRYCQSVCSGMNDYPE